MEYFHVRVSLKKTDRREELNLFDLSRDFLDDRILNPRARGEHITVKGRTLTWDEIEALKIGRSSQPADDIVPIIKAEDRDRRAGSRMVVLGGRSPKQKVVDWSADVTDELVVGAPGHARATGSKKAAELTNDDPARRRRVMVVMGRDAAANKAMFDFLRDLDLKPQEWTQLVADTGSASPYIGEVLDRAMETVQAVVVLMTPDDEVRLRDELGKDESSPTYQPRPNVLFEAGLAFGRHPTRTIIVEYGDLRGLSDLHGRHVVRIDRGVEQLRELARRLETAGCAVDTDGSSWLDVSRFPVRPAESKKSASTRLRISLPGISAELRNP